MDTGDSAALPTNSPVTSFKVFENISSRDLIADAVKIRETVFVVEQNVPADLELDEYDFTAIHVIMYVDNQPAGNGRIVLKDDDKWYIGRVAILKEFRGKSYGKVLMQEITKVAQEKGLKEVFIHAQIQVVPFYERLGWKSFGEEFEEAGIVHKHMSIELGA